MTKLSGIWVYGAIPTQGSQQGKRTWYNYPLIKVKNLKTGAKKHMPVISVLGRKKQEDAWGFQASQSSQINEF